jgi:hypothetical protein
MKKILEFESYSSDSLTDAEKSEIVDLVKKYEKYFNFHDTKNFNTELKNIVNDISIKLNINKDKINSIEEYLKDLYELSDGLSVIMAPGPEIVQNGIDQVQRFQY